MGIACSLQHKTPLQKFSQNFYERNSYYAVEITSFEKKNNLKTRTKLFFQNNMVLPFFFALTLS